MEKQSKNFENQNISGGGVKWYREKIFEMVEQIEDEKYLKMIYGFVKRLHKE